VGSTFRRSRVRTLAKRELFLGPVATVFFRWMEAIPIDRKGYDERAFDEARAALAAGDCLFIFPEGTRRPPGRPGPVKGGLGILAQETGAPILPIFVRGTGALRFGGNPESPLEVRYGPLVRLHALERLRRDLDPRQITERVGAMFQAMIEELQARSRAERPESAAERALAVRQRHRRRSRRPFD
jgi:1-acyl-sn-glycerol-3-phosphate acyltransferase